MSGILGPRVVSPSLPVMKEASSSVRGSKVVVKESLDCSSSKKKVDELGLRLGKPFPRISEGGAPIYCLQVPNRVCPESEGEDC